MSFLGTVPTNAFWGVVLFTAPLRHCINYCPSGALCSVLPCGALCSALAPTLDCPSGAVCSALPIMCTMLLYSHFWGTVLCSAPFRHYALHSLSCALLCTAPLRHLALHCPSWALCFYTVLLGHCAHHCLLGCCAFHCPSEALYYLLPFWGTVLFTTLKGQCSALPL